ncbi:MAG: hypothetical protein ACRD72_16685, partial [Candidatus Angelobacter sp.]
LELTCAANFLCDEIRRTLDRSFMLEEGKLTVRAGDEAGEYLPEYKKGQRYQGLEAFEADFMSRRFFFPPRK